MGVGEEEGRRRMEEMRWEDEDVDVGGRGMGRERREWREERREERREWREERGRL